MKKCGSVFVALPAIVVLLSGCGSNQEVGFLVGTPTGISYAETLESGYRIHAAAGVSPGGLEVTVDYIHDELSMRQMMDAHWSFYYGVGARLRTYSGSGDDEVGLRVPLGLNYNADPVWAGLIFLEVGPGIAFPGPTATFDVAIGARWYL
jgi:hypothetical protein